MIFQISFAGKEFLNEEVMRQQLTENPGFSIDYLPGFKFRGLSDSTIFFDNNHLRMVQNYRNAFMRLAVHYRNTYRNDMLVSILDEMNAKLPYDIIGIDNGLLFEIGNLYRTSGKEDKYKEIASFVEQRALADLEKNPEDVSSYYNPYRILIETYENLQSYDKLVMIWEKLEQMYPNDPTVKASIQKYKQLLEQKDTVIN